MSVCMLDYCYDVCYVQLLNIQFLWLWLFCWFSFIYCTAVVIGQRNALHLTLEKGWNLITNKVSQCYVRVLFVYIPICGCIPYLSSLLTHTTQPFRQTLIRQTRITLREALRKLPDITEEFRESLEQHKSMRDWKVFLGVCDKRDHQINLSF